MARGATTVDAPVGVVEAIDEELVQKAVDDIKAILSDTVAKGFNAVGEYVLKTFFHNDIEKVRSRDSNKASSFRALAGRCGSPDLPLSKSTLHAAVSVAAMRRELPQGAAFRQLPPSHQTALLPLREQPDAAEKLAQKALTRSLPVRALREDVGLAVAKARKDGPPRGRPPLPVVVKTLDRTAKLFELDAGRRSFTKIMVEELDDDQAKAALKIARTLAARLEGLIEKLEAR